MRRASRFRVYLLGWLWPIGALMLWLQLYHRAIHSLIITSNLCLLFHSYRRTSSPVVKWAAMRSLRTLTLQRVSDSTFVIFHRRSERSIRSFNWMHIKFHRSLVRSWASTCYLHHSFVLLFGIFFVRLLRVLMTIGKHTVSFIDYLVWSQLLLNDWYVWYFWLIQVLIVVLLLLLCFLIWFITLLLICFVKWVLHEIIIHWNSLLHLRLKLSQRCNLSILIIDVYKFEDLVSCV